MSLVRLLLLLGPMNLVLRHSILTTTDYCTCSTVRAPGLVLRTLSTTLQIRKRRSDPTLVRHFPFTELWQHAIVFPNPADMQK